MFEKARVWLVERLKFLKFVEGKTAVGVLLLIVLMLLAVARDTHAQELSLELGQTVNNVRDGGVLWLDSRWLEAGPGDSDVSIGAYLITESRTTKSGVDVPRQAGIYAQISDNLGPVEVGIGVTYQKNDDIVVSDPLRFTLLVGLNLNTGRRWWAPDRLYIRHNSNAGTGDRNSGWDFLMIGWHVR